MGSPGAAMGCPWAAHGLPVGCPWDAHVMNRKFILCLRQILYIFGRTQLITFNSQSFGMICHTELVTSQLVGILCHIQLITSQLVGILLLHPTNN